LINKAKLARQLRNWHRRIGLFLLIWVFFVALTGISLNHAKDFGFDTAPLPPFILKSVYGVESPEVTSFYAGGGWLSHVTGNQLYWNKTALGFCQGLVGVASYNNEIYAACRDTVFILDTQGQVIERINAGYGIPLPIEQFGTCNDLPCIQIDGASQVFDPAMFSWVTSDAEFIGSKPDETPDGLGTYLKDLNSPPDFTLQRLVQDLHNGAFFGLGPWLMDIFAIGLMAMSAMGGFIWWLGRRR